MAVASGLSVVEEEDGGTGATGMGVAPSGRWVMVRVMVMVMMGVTNETFLTCTICYFSLYVFLL